MTGSVSRTHPYQGGCLCGAVRFEIRGPIEDIVMCHCSQCRKVQGTAYATNGNVAANNFVFLSGEDNLTTYAVSDDQNKYFCRTCGSPIMSRRASHPNQVRIRLGTIESDIEERPGAHIFVGSKANWDEVADDVPQFDEFEDG
ncbi:MAG TPA: GFA family protein [Gammaproteobacteria bacterium]|nr:GFA family protein [Gammaproteobacteria bacterium]